MTETRDGAVTGGSSDAPRAHAEAGASGCMALPALLVLTVFVLGGVSVAAGERCPWPLPASAGLPLKVSGLAGVAASLVILAAWGVHAAYAHVSARLSQWLEAVQPAIAEMSVFVAAYLVAASQPRRCHPFDDGSRGFRDPTASPPQFDRERIGDEEGGGGSAGPRNKAGAGSWRLVAGVVFWPKLASGTAAGERTGGRGGGVGPREVAASTRAPRDKGNKRVPTSP